MKSSKMQVDVIRKFLTVDNPVNQHQLMTWLPRSLIVESSQWT